MVNPYKNPSDISSKDRVEAELEELLTKIHTSGEIKQKDLRKELPYSEAKASMLLCILKNRHKIRKTKVGRDNFIEARS
jgi:uncharacterized membrane protein